MAWAALILATGVLLSLATATRWGALGLLWIVPSVSWAGFLLSRPRAPLAPGARTGNAPLAPVEPSAATLLPAPIPPPSLTEVFSRLPGLQLACDRDGRLLALSSALTKRIGSGRDDGLGLPLATLFEPSDHASLAALLTVPPHPAPPQRVAPLQLRSALGPSEAVAVEYTVRTNPGAAPTFHLLLMPLPAAGMSPVEEGIEAGVFRTIVDDQPELVSLALPDGELVYVNRAYCAAFGRTRTQLVGRSLFDLVPEADHAEVLRHLQRVLESGRVIVDQNRMSLAGGAVRWVEWMNRTLSVPGWNSALIYSVGRDVTERRQAEEAIRLLQRDQSAIMNSEMIGIAKVRERHYQWVNPGFARILGYESAELAGMPSQCVFPDGETFQALGEEAYPMIRAGRTFRGEYRMLRKDGRTIWVETTGVLVDPERDETLWLLTDITARKEAESALQARTGAVPG